MRHLLRLAAVLPILLSTSAIAGDPPKDTGTCAVERPQLEKRCRPGGSPDIITCSGESLLPAHTLSPHVRTCELRFSTPAIGQKVAVEVKVLNAPPGFMFSGAQSDEWPNETQVVLWVKAPSPAGFTGKEPIRIAYTVTARMRPASSGK